MAGGAPNGAEPPRGRFTIVYLIHEAFRRDIGRLSASVRTPGVDRTRAAQLRAHWDFVSDQLHHHHLIEDETLWPLVRPKLEGREAQLAVLATMEAEHQALQPKTDSVEEAFAAFSTDPTEPSGVALGNLLDQCGLELSAHLDDEETNCFPVVDEALSVEEFNAFGKATAKAVGMRGSAHFFPWIFEGADPVERKAVLSMPPAPVRLLCTYAWEPRYKRQAAALWAS